MVLIHSSKTKNLNRLLISPRPKMSDLYYRTQWRRNNWYQLPPRLILARLASRKTLSRLSTQRKQLLCLQALL